jgi:hypothetical protein
MNPLRVRIPNTVAYAAIGVGLGLMTGLLLARNHGERVGGGFKDGGNRKQTAAHQYSRTSMPVGAGVGAVLGAVIGFVIDKFTRAAKPTAIPHLTPDFEQVARSHFQANAGRTDGDAIRPVDEEMRKDDDA